MVLILKDAKNIRSNIRSNIRKLINAKNIIKNIIINSVFTTVKPSLFGRSERALEKLVYPIQRKKPRSI